MTTPNSTPNFTPKSPWELIGKEITGKQFNELYKDEPLHKFTNKTENQFGFQYVDGLNVDVHPFDLSHGDCSKGGLYFTSVINADCGLYRWLYDKEYVRSVKVPDDARVCIYIDKFKADKIIVGPRVRIIDSDLFINTDVQKLIANDGRMIKFIKNPSEQLQLKMVQRNGCNIKYIKDPSENIQLTAILQNSKAINYINNPTKNAKRLASSGGSQCVIC